jgi:hypothetical protein
VAILLRRRLLLSQGVRDVRLLSKTQAPQQYGRVTADLALSGVGGLASAVKLHERACQVVSMEPIALPKVFAHRSCVR